MGSGVAVESVSEVTPELLEAFDRLLPQLSSSAPRLSAEALGRVAGFEGNRLFVARVDGRIVGSCLLVVFPAPSGSRALLEDVVVDSASRGGGIGTALVQAVVDAAREAGVRTLDLTSRPSREAANRLYARCGFARRETNVWRIEL